MLTLLVTFPTARIVSPTDTVNLYWNVSARGLATGAIDAAHRVNDQGLVLFAGVGPGPTWQRTPWGHGPWSGREAVSTLAFETPPVCWGKVRLAGKAVDSLGNEQAGALIETDQMVNSTPQAPNRPERGAFAAGRQTILFRASPQVRT